MANRLNDFATHRIFSTPDTGGTEHLKPLAKNKRYTRVLLYGVT